MSTAVETARQEWEEGNRRFAARAHDERLLVQVGLVTEELRRRIGQVFTLAELADEYGRADRWAHEIVAERAAFPGWALTLSLVEQVAFHNYARGAIDYAP